MTSFFKELFEYNTHFNQQLISKFTAFEPTVSQKAIYLQNHIINAHQIWNCRLSTGDTFGVYEMHPTLDLAVLDESNYAKTMTVLENMDLDTTINYKTSKGEEFTNSVRDVLFHIINHSTYHRAQIATEFKACSIEPVPTDYILYKRDLTEDLDFSIDKY